MIRGVHRVPLIDGWIQRLSFYSMVYANNYPSSISLVLVMFVRWRGIIRQMAGHGSPDGGASSVEGINDSPHPMQHNIQQMMIITCQFRTMASQLRWPSTAAEAAAASSSCSAERTWGAPIGLDWGCRAHPVHVSRRYQGRPSRPNIGTWPCVCWSRMRRKPGRRTIYTSARQTKYKRPSIFADISKLWGLPRKLTSPRGGATVLWKRPSTKDE